MKLVLVDALCHNCGWASLEAKNGMATASRHAKKYGHDVGVEVRYIHVFKGSATSQERQ